MLYKYPKYQVADPVSAPTPKTVTLQTASQSQHVKLNPLPQTMGACSINPHPGSDVYSLYLISLL